MNRLKKENKTKKNIFIFLCFIVAIFIAWQYWLFVNYNDKWQVMDDCPFGTVSEFYEGYSSSFGNISGDSFPHYECRTYIDKAFN